MTAISHAAPAGAEPSSTLRKIVAAALDRSEAGRARRLAAAAFAARVMNAGLGFATQILLARWMGEREYGVYAYVWVWVLVAGGIGSLGLPVAALKFIPDYGRRGDRDGLRGFLLASRTAGIVPCAAAALLTGAALWLFGRGEAALYVPVALLGLVTLPVYVLTDIQTGIARAYDDMDLGLAADYVMRPVLLLAFCGLILVAGGSGTAVHVMLATLAGMAVTAFVQGVLLQARLHVRVPAGPRRYDLRRWADVSWPLLTVTGFTLLLGSTDVLVLKLFVGPEQIALYFAATKIVAVASFVSYGVANTSAHRFASHMATGDRSAMAALAAETVRWTFWPTLAVAAGLALGGGPLLSLFGPGFAKGATIVAILGAGLVAGASVGPADRALAMADHGRVAALIYGASFAANLGLALLLIPAFGLNGAALATALAMAGRAGLLFVAARRRLGLDMFVFAPASPQALSGAGYGSDELAAEFLDASAARAISGEWHALADRAIEPNLFYGPATAFPGLEHLPEGRGGRILAVWRGAGSARRLVGILPLVPPRRRHANPFSLRRAGEFYGTLSTPLVDPDRPGETLRAMLRGARRHGIGSLLLPFLHMGGPVALALDEVSTRHGKAQVTLGSHRRAFLRSPLAGSEYVRATLEPRRRKEADRQRRRLAEEGALRFSVAASEAEVAEALETFLDLEAGGWKGQAGTDLRHAPGAAPFIRSSARDLARDGRFRVATLTLAGRTIAAGLVGIAGRRAFYLKTAYDEAYSRFSPGLLLTLDLTAHLLDDPSIDEADSIAVADHPMIDRVWTERFPVASILVATGPNSRTFRLALRCEHARERLVAELKAARIKISGWRQRRRNPVATKAEEDPPA